MCLYLKNSNVKVLIADKEIPVYKVLNINYNSPYLNMSYRNKNVTKKSKILRCRTCVKNGLHSCLTIRAAKSIAVGNKMCIIVKMYIPKGAKYYLGMYNEVASNQLNTSDLEVIYGKSFLPKKKKV